MIWQSWCNSAPVIGLYWGVIYKVALAPPCAQGNIVGAFLVDDEYVGTILGLVLRATYYLAEASIWLSRIFETQFRTFWGLRSMASSGVRVAPRNRLS